MTKSEFSARLERIRKRRRELCATIQHQAVSCQFSDVFKAMSKEIAGPMTVLMPEQTVKAIKEWKPEPNPEDLATYKDKRGNRDRHSNIFPTIAYVKDMLLKIEWLEQKGFPDDQSMNACLKLKPHLREFSKAMKGYKPPTS